MVRSLGLLLKCSPFFFVMQFLAPTTLLYAPDWEAIDRYYSEELATLTANWSAGQPIVDYPAHRFFVEPETTRIGDLNITTIPEKFVLEGRSYYDSTAVYIGISHKPESDLPHHYFLIANRLLREGPLMPPDAILPPMVKTVEYDVALGHKIKILTDSIVFKLQVGQEITDQVAQTMRQTQNEYCFTCIDAVVSVLEEAGFRFGRSDEVGPAYIGSPRILVSLLKQDVRRNGGKVPMELIMPQDNEALLTCLRYARFSGKFMGKKVNYTRMYARENPDLSCQAIKAALYKVP